MTKIPLTVACLISFAPLAQAQAPTPDPWADVRFLVGEWRGSINSEEGKGTVTKSFRLILSGMFLQEKSRFDFPPQPNFPNGMVTTHASFLAQDRTRKLMLYRQHHEDYRKGSYFLAKDKSGPAKVVFEAEPSMNAPTVWSVRETWEVVSPNAFVEIIEVAQDGKTFVVQSRTAFQRRQPEAPVTKK